MNINTTERNKSNEYLSRNQCIYIYCIFDFLFTGYSDSHQAV